MVKSIVALGLGMLFFSCDLFSALVNNPQEGDAPPIVEMPPVNIGNSPDDAGPGKEDSDNDDRKEIGEEEDRDLDNVVQRFVIEVSPYNETVSIMFSREYYPNLKRLYRLNDDDDDPFSHLRLLRNDNAIPTTRRRTYDRYDVRYHLIDDIDVVAEVAYTYVIEFLDDTGERVIARSNPETAVPFEPFGETLANDLQPRFEAKNGVMRVSWQSINRIEQYFILTQYYPRSERGYGIALPASTTEYIFPYRSPDEPMRYYAVLPRFRGTYVVSTPQEQLWQLPHAIGLRANTNAVSIDLFWDELSTDIASEPQYDLYRNGALVKTVSGFANTDQGLNPGDYEYYIVAHHDYGSVTSETIFATIQ